MMPPTRAVSLARLSASVLPDTRMARACWTWGGSTTATVRIAASGCLSAFAGGGVSADWSAALPTEENSPVATHAAVAISTATAATL